MTLNDEIALILRYFTEFDTFGGRLRHNVVDKFIMTDAEYALPVIFWPKLTHAAVARSLCDS